MHVNYLYVRLLGKYMRVADWYSRIVSFRNAACHMHPQQHSKTDVTLCPAML